MKIYYEQNTDLELLKGHTVAILGFGSQGHAHALNLRDSGVSVVVAQRAGGPNYEKAKQMGFEPVGVSKAVAQADIVMNLLPDQLQAAVYKNDVAPNLKSGATLLFAHGFSVHYNQIEAPVDVNVAMVAPKGPGHMVRRTFQEGGGVPCLIAVHQDATGQTLPLALAYAAGIGGARSGVMETSFREETETDLFGEQAVLCGGVSALIKAGYDTLVEAGYQPEMAYFECLHELKLITDLIYEGGLAKMRYSISDTAEYGDYSRGGRIITDETRRQMKKILAEIQDGTFAREWILESQAGYPCFKAMRRQEAEHGVEKTGAPLRRMMGWLRDDKE